MAEILPHVNASLNALATVLLVLGYVLIRRGQEARHKRVMLACFAVSTLFLVSYSTYHVMIEGSKKFPSYPPDVVRYTYFAILISHIVLATAVPVLAVIAIWLGLRDRRTAHRRVARWTWPIWLYVSITGVVIYLLLYQLYPPSEAASILP